MASRDSILSASRYRKPPEPHSDAPSLLWLCLSWPVLCCAALNDLFLACWPVLYWEGAFAPQLCRNSLYSEGCFIQAEIKVQSLKSDIQQNISAQNISGKATGRESRACIGRNTNADTWESSLLLNGTFPKLFPKQAAQILKKKTHPNLEETNFRLHHYGLSPASKLPV